MKSIFATIAILTLSMVTQAQLTLEKHYDYSANTVKINNTDYKLYIMDVPNSQCRIYNPDHSLYKTINLPVPANSYLYDIKFVSQNMFNSDTKIELLYTYYAYITTDTAGNGYYEYNTKIINESGTVLVSAPKVVYSYIKEHSAGVYKLYLYSTDYSSWPYKVGTDIYNIPGTVQTSVITTSADNAIKPAFPNPATSLVTLPYALNHGSTKGIIKILDTKGNEVAQYTVDNAFNNLIIPVETMPKGTYFYYLETENHLRNTVQKFIIN